MNQIKTQLTEIVCFFEITRAVGHTTAMIEGAKNTPNCIVVAANLQDGERIEAIEGPGANYMVMGLPGIREGRLVGMKRPLLFDNHALHTLLKDSLTEIRRLENKLAEINRRAHKHAAEVAEILRSE